MKKAEIIKIIVPATIAQWTAETPHYRHAGKERQIANMYSTWDKNSLETKLGQLIEKGYVK